jgi:hypothetical protein
MTDNSDPKVVDVDEALPTMEPKTRSLVKRVTTIAAAGGLVALAADSAVRRFKARKNVTVVVEDKDPDSPA